jgi:hypothetical protein
MYGGQVGMRGYLVQTLIALLAALDDEQSWRSVTLEPSIDSDKVDLLWQYNDGCKAVQVKSSQNAFSESSVKRWAAELEAWRHANHYELVLVGTPATARVAAIRKVGNVDVPPAKNLDLPAFNEQAAHRLEGFLRTNGLPEGTGNYREMLASALADKLATLATRGLEFTRDELVTLLRAWIIPAKATDKTREHVNLALDHLADLINSHVKAVQDVTEPLLVREDIAETATRYRLLVNNPEFPQGYGTVRGTLEDARTLPAFQDPSLIDKIKAVLHELYNFQYGVFTLGWDSYGVSDAIAECAQVVANQHASPADFQRAAGPLVSTYRNLFKEPGSDPELPPTSHGLIRLVTLWFQTWQRYVQRTLYGGRGLNYAISQLRMHL